MRVERLKKIGKTVRLIFVFCYKELVIVLTVVLSHRNISRHLDSQIQNQNEVITVLEKKVSAISATSESKPQGWLMAYLRGPMVKDAAVTGLFYFSLYLKD